MLSRGRALAGSGLLLAASLGLSALVLEVGLRVAGYLPEAARPRPRMLKGRRLILDCYPDGRPGQFPVDLRDAATRAAYRPGLGPAVDEAALSTPLCVEARYNDLRFRDREFPPRREGVRRVVALGDSFTEGQGVREAEAWPQVLGRLLESAEPGRWEVLNCGQRGLDFPPLREMFDRLQDLEPDLVVHGFVLNDGEHERTFAERYPALGDWIADRVRGEGEAPASRLLAFVGDRVRQLRVSHQTLRFYRDLYAEPNAAGLDRTLGHLRHMNRSQKAHGRRFLVALWPLLVGLPDAYPFEDVHARLRQACDRAGVPFLDLLPALRSQQEAALTVHGLDRHPSARAHLLVAERIADRLLARPAGPR